MKVPTAIIGLGKIGLTYDLDESGHLKPDQVMTHCRSVWNSKFFRIEQLIDPNVDHVRQATKIFGGAGFRSITEATALPSPQFVIVSVPTQLHLRTLELIAKTWSPLVYLIEKPFGGDSRQATQMASLLQTQSATVYVNYFRRYLPNIISLKSSSIFQERGRLYSVKIKGYGTLENIFSHFLDLLLFLETPSTLGLTKKLKSNSEIGMLKFKDPTSGIQYEFDGVGFFARDCEMTLKYEDLIINITANGRCLQINDIHGRTFKEFNMEKSIFNNYQSLVIEKIAKDFGTNNMNTCVEDAILIHTFLESI